MFLFYYYKNMISMTSYLLGIKNLKLIRSFRKEKKSFSWLHNNIVKMNNLVLKK